MTRCMTVGELKAEIAKLEERGIIGDNTSVVIGTEHVDPDYDVMTAHTVEFGIYCIEDYEEWSLTHDGEDPPDTECLVLRAT